MPIDSRRLRAAELCPPCMFIFAKWTILKAAFESTAGLADSLVGAVTLFWVAVLQRRAFAMSFGDLGAYEWAFDQPNVNWTWYV